MKAEIRNYENTAEPQEIALFENGPLGFDVYVGSVFEPERLAIEQYGKGLIKVKWLDKNGNNFVILFVEQVTDAYFLSHRASGQKPLPKGDE